MKATNAKRCPSHSGYTSAAKLVWNLAVVTFINEFVTFFFGLTFQAIHDQGKTYATFGLPILKTIHRRMKRTSIWTVQI